MVIHAQYVSVTLNLLLQEHLVKTLQLLQVMVYFLLTVLFEGGGQGACIEPPEVE